ncbi:MAG: hypothetical protein K8S00_08600, partial [Bacteroidales bacterium]|nr:hypothetical protein [Bacteroidales bacterium]
NCKDLTAMVRVNNLCSNGSTSAIINVCPTTTTSYTVTVTDVNGCTDADEVIVTVWPLPTANAGDDVSICQNNCTDLTAMGGVNYLWNTGSTSATINVCPTTTTTYTVTVTDVNGCTASDDVIVSVTTCGTPVTVKTLLQGAYAGGGLMHTNLQSILPNNQPYNRSPWNYTGTETLNSIPANMADWILVELRNATNPAVIIAQRVAILLNNGNIADTNLASSVNFDGISAGNYYLCLHHCNHMPVMSETPIAIPNVSVYDFSDTLNFPPYGGGSQALIKLESGIFGMIAGDVNSDGQLKYSGPGNDRGLVLQRIVNESGSTSITTTINGYFDEDIIMNGIVKYSGPGNDPSMIIQNLVKLTGSTSITVYYTTPVPQGQTSTKNAN